MRYIPKLALALALAVPQLSLASFDTNDWVQRASAEKDINNLGKLYLELRLEESPTAGIYLGVHGRGDDVDYYDSRLPDPSSESSARFDTARDALLAQLNAIDTSKLSRPDQIDLHILSKRIQLDLFNSRELKSGDSPFNWSSTLSSGLSGLIMRDYAPLEQRLGSLGARCAATGDYLDSVKQRLSPESVQPTAQHKATALGQFKGLDREGGLFDRNLPELLASSKLDENQRAAITTSCDQAREDIRLFTAWLEKTIMPRTDGEWRTGKDLYDRQYDLQLDYPLGPDELLAEAERWLDEKSTELATIGRKIHDSYLATEIEAGTATAEKGLSDSDVVRQIFDKMSEDRPTVDSLIEDSYALADSIVGFVEQNDLMDLPPASKLRIEAVPPQLSGNATAFIMTAPPMEPHLESVWYWDLELLRGAEDYLKEYNNAVLALVYIHEGVPGHFVQLEYSNRAERLIPKVFWNGPMVEGWATYITTQLVAEGYTVYPEHPLGHELQQMADIKMVLRSLTNAIMDIRLNRSDWSEEEALKLMTEKGYQQPGEAQGKLGRARMGAVQLASYFAGHLAIENILEEYRQSRGDEFSYKEFNERLVGAGSPPFFAIREFMLQDAAE